MKNIPRNEYPRPQWQRDDNSWECLNGTWQFEFDPGDSGFERGLAERELSGEILVPFCPESSLSGIGDVDFHTAVWYRRNLSIPAAWSGQRIVLHFEAVDYDTTVWVNGIEVGRHRGGGTGFSCDVTPVLKADGNTLVVRARDNHRDPAIPAGKQSFKYHNETCHYTRTTGIWQTVWMEALPQTAWLKTGKIFPGVERSRFRLEVPVGGQLPGGIIEAALLIDGEVVVTDSTTLSAEMIPELELAVSSAQRRLWEIEDPYLYTIQLTLKQSDGSVVDRVETYAGLRSVSLDRHRVLLNGKPVFQRLVLDQGYYPNGILTAPSDQALIDDIQLSQAAGFNGARLHQKIFEQRFLYHADRLGYLVWSEFSDWSPKPKAYSITHVTQWMEAVARDFNHPSIVGWCPLNETNDPILDSIQPHDDAMHALFLATKQADPTRPVLDTSGHSHRVPETDIYDSHDYDQNAETFRARHARLGEGIAYANEQLDNTPYVPGTPYFVSEFGGAWWSDAVKDGTDQKQSWGYGDQPKTIEEFYQRFEGLCGALLANPFMFGYCYTQLTDVFQEENGIYTFERKPKFNLERLKAVQTKQAAIEQT